MSDQPKDARVKMLIVACVLLVLVIVLVVIWCFCFRKREIAVVRFVCPGDPVVVDIVDGSTGEVLRTMTGLPQSEPITDIPEFHDCQRLIVAGEYDSLYAIFAAFRLDSLTATFGHDSSLAIDEGRPYGIVPVATIYSHGGKYLPLGIEPGFNCLFLYKTGTGANRKWAATMVASEGSTDPDCGDRTYDPYSTGTDLEVDTLVDASFQLGDNAPVARWDWDPQNKQHYIGIACGRAWCEVGKEGFQSSAAYAVPQLRWRALGGVIPSNTSVTYNRVFKVKGWYDTQPLEVMVGNRMQPSGPHGFLIPHPELETTNNDKGLPAYEDEWNHVANAVVDADYNKWNLKTDQTNQNEIWFCYGTEETCKITSALPRVPASSIPLTDCRPDPTNADRRWWAKVVSATNDTAYACVERRDHAAELEAYRIDHPGQGTIRIPGATRWRYIPTDAGQWISCPEGCCTIR